MPFAPAPHTLRRAAAFITISLSNQKENECKRNLSAASKPDTENTTLHTKKQKRFIETSSGDPFVGAAPRGGAHLLAAVRATRPSDSQGLTLSGTAVASRYQLCRRGSTVL